MMDKINKVIIKPIVEDLVLSHFVDMKRVYFNIKFDLFYILMMILSPVLLKRTLLDLGIGSSESFIGAIILWIMILTRVYLKKEFLVYDLADKGYDKEYSVKKYFKLLITNLFHKIIPQKEYRWHTINNKVYKQTESEEKFRELFYLDYKSLFDSDIQSFLNQYFNRKERTLIKFYRERLYDGYGSLQDNFIFYSMIIPKRKELSVDALKTILINNQFPPEIGYAPDDFSLSEMLSNEKISESFIEYNELQLKRIFTKYYDYEHLLEIVRIISNHTIKIPIKPSIEEIYYYLLAMEKQMKKGEYFLKQENNNIKLKSLSTKFNRGDDVYEFYILKNLKDMYDWGRELKNCLNDDDMEYKNKIIRGKIFIIGLYKNDKKYSLIAIDKSGRINEIKKKLNKPLSDAEEAFINSQFLKYYN